MGELRPQIITYARLQVRSFMQISTIAHARALLLHCERGIARLKPASFYLSIAPFIFVLRSLAIFNLHIFRFAPSREESFPARAHQ